MTLYGEGLVFFLRTSAIIKRAWLCLLPSHLGNNQASIIFGLSSVDIALGLSSVDCRLLPRRSGKPEQAPLSSRSFVSWLCLLPSHLGNIQASIILLSVCRQLTVVYFLVARDSRSKLRSPLAPSSVVIVFYLFLAIIIIEDRPVVCAERRQR